ncbi:MAG: Era-like GTP-binding protein [Candidatus Micrarchaeota archaeon]|nr:Era-like GTP-binding protein [Candidatus Micrarchaeota archaeon]
MIGRLLDWLKGIFGKKKNITIGIYGSPNVGKTTLANRICVDLAGEPVGAVSPVPHETRTVQRKDRVVLKLKGYALTMNVLDMPGIAVKVDYRDFLEYGLSKEEAQKRAREATRGVVEAVRHLDKVDAALFIIDATEDPYTQVNITILGNIEARNIPVIIVANKIDLPKANTKRVREAFPGYEVVDISAMTGENLEALYLGIAEKLS